MSQAKVPTVYISLLLDEFIYLWERCFLQRGIKLISAAKELCGGESTRPLLVEIQCFYACILSNLGRIDEAEKLFQEQVLQRKGRMTKLGKSGIRPSMEDEFLLANAYNNLVGIQCAQGHYHEAELRNTLSLDLKQRWINEKDMDLLLSLSHSNLGNLYGRQGKWRDSALNFEKALDLGRSVILGQALTAQNYGWTRRAEGQVDKARDLLTIAFRMRSDKLGDHHETASTLHMLAMCHHTLGELNDARYVHGTRSSTTLTACLQRPSPGSFKDVGGCGGTEGYQPHRPLDASPCSDSARPE